MRLAKPVISCVLPCWNGSKYLERTILAFLSQKYERKELIIVDGKSTDGSHEIISKYADSCENIRWLKYADTSILDAFEHGVERSSGDIISYLGDDDLLCDGILERIAWLSEHVDIDAVYFDSYTYWIKKNRIDLRRCPDIPFTAASLFSFGTIVGFQDIFFRKHVLRENRLPIGNHFSFDYEYYLMLSVRPYLFMHVPEPATINIFDDNMSDTLAHKQYEEACIVTKKYAALYNYSGPVHFSDNGRLARQTRSLAKRLLKRLNPGSVLGRL